MPLLGGDCLGPYTIVAPLGKGGMGEVYRARDTRLNRDVALKVLPQSVAADTERMARFTREAQVLASLNHPNIAQIYGIEESGGTRALVMELVEGRTLDQAIPQGGISLAQFFDVAMALADALHAAYQKRITHRDLKPANIMLTEDGRVKVLDFGLARVAEAEPTEPANFESEATKVGLTQAGTIIGTVPYMSPEQIEARPLDHRTDLFSLGVLLYEMATGTRPFRGDTSPSLMASILREHPKPVSQMRPDMPAEISQLIGRCLEKDPGTRVQTAQEVLVELRVQRRIYESGSRTSSTGPASLPSGSRAGDMKIAVLPLSCRTASKEFEDLADGLTDDITTGLSRFPYLTVVSRSEASDRAARYLLEGSLRASGAAVRVSMRLVDSETGAHLWAETYDRQFSGTNVFDVQDDITSRVVATVADSHGVLVRFMAMSLKDRPCEELTVSELVLRFFVYLQNFRVEEHARLRQSFESALQREPLHALGWACLSGLYSEEYGFGMNESPDALERMRQAAERAIEIDPLCQIGWRDLAAVHAFARDLTALRSAAERTISLNPLNSVAAASVGAMLAWAGDWERGLEIVRHAMTLNANHAGYYYVVFSMDHYRRREHEEALAAAKRVNMPGWPMAILAVVAAAGQLGRIGEARAALESLAKVNPGLLDLTSARKMWARWVWDEELVDSFAEGFLKAKALVEGVGGEAKKQPPSGMGRTMATAVVPFTTHNDDPDAKALASGLSDDIPAGLSRFPYLSVAREPQSARYLIEGSVRKAATTIRVSARLVDAETGAHMWAETYTRDTQAADVFALQDDITNHIVATVADASGVLVRSMGNPLRDRPCDELTTSELILRYQVFMQQFQPDEHARLRVAFESALKREPAHAEAWACLAMLCHHEYAHSFNSLPDSLGRLRAAAQRATEIDPVCQRGWWGLAMWSFYMRDLPGLRAAGERAISLNPLSTTILASTGMLRAYAGDWEEGVAYARQAMDLNPHHPGWFYWPSFYNCYRQRAYEEAFQIAKRFNMPAFYWTPICTAATSGKLGIRAEAQAALEALDKIEPALLQPERLRAALAIWQWDEQLLDDLMDGFLKAKALAEVKPVSGQFASIAVLPFTDMSEAKDQEWFCDGIAEEILNALTHLKGLNVAARTSAFSFRGKGDDLRTIGEKLQVTTVLEGSVRRSGDRLRITVQLNQVSNGYRLWSERYDRELKDIFDVQDEIAKAIAERLRVTLTGGEEARLVPKATENMEAYQLYLKGRALLYQRGSSIAPALEMFQKAAELDPGYALAWAGIADAYTVLSYFGFLRGQDGRPQAMAAARRSIELDPDSAEAHTALACATLLQGGDRHAVEMEFARSLAINPSYIQGRAWYALFYLQWTCGRFNEGIAEARRALASDPLSAYAKTILVFCLTTANQPSEAVEVGRAAVQADPASFLARWALAQALSAGDRFEEAMVVFEEACKMSARHCFAISSLAMALSRWGKLSEARALHQELMDRAAVGYIPLFQLALTAAAAGEYQQALDFAERAWHDREPGIYLFARHWTDYNWFRQQPRFSAILRELDAL